MRLEANISMYPTNGFTAFTTDLHSRFLPNVVLKFRLPGIFTKTQPVLHVGLFQMYGTNRSDMLFV
jgi:hypothetical protein